MLLLKRVLGNPLIHLFIGLLMLITSLSEAWDTLADDLKNFELGTRHSVGVFGLVYALKSLLEVLENLIKTKDAVEVVEELEEQ